jgi:hypothetical protein
MDNPFHHWLNLTHPSKGKYMWYQMYLSTKKESRTVQMSSTMWDHVVHLVSSSTRQNCIAFLKSVKHYTGKNNTEIVVSRPRNITPQKCVTHSWINIRYSLMPWETFQVHMVEKKVLFCEFNFLILYHDARGQCIPIQSIYLKSYSSSRKSLQMQICHVHYIKSIWIIDIQNKSDYSTV